MENESKYLQYKKPSWAPPSWLFGPVWTILYILIAISFGYVCYSFFNGSIPFSILLPFILNLVFNFAFTPIQFRLQNFPLALVDILLVDITLIWAISSIYSYAPWVTYMNIPYLIWVLFATILQISVTVLNWKKA